MTNTAAPVIGRLRELRSLDSAADNYQLMEDFLEDLRFGGRSEKTIQAYGDALEDFEDFVMHLDLLKATHREVREFLHWLHAQGSSAQTVIVKKYALSSFYDYLLRINAIKSSPVRLVPNPRTQRKIPKVLSVEQCRRLIRGCRTIRDRSVVEIMWATGCRISEIRGMCVSDINWTERTILVFGKGSKERLVPLTKPATETLRVYLKDRERGPVFTKQEATGTVFLEGRTWRGYWRENEKQPDGSIKRRDKCKVVGYGAPPKHRSTLTIDFLCCWITLPLKRLSQRISLRFHRRGCDFAILKRSDRSHRATSGVSLMEPRVVQAWDMSTPTCCDIVLRRICWRMAQTSVPFRSFLDTYRY